MHFQQLPKVSVANTVFWSYQLNVFHTKVWVVARPIYTGEPTFSLNLEKRYAPALRELDGFSHVVVLWWCHHVDEKKLRRLTEFESMSWAPFFHPSGEYAIFVSNKLGFDNFELFIVDAEGKHEPVQVTHTPGFDGLPTFSPDGATIVWTSNHTNTGMSQLFIASWDHEAALNALAEAPLRKAKTAPRSETAPNGQ